MTSGSRVLKNFVPLCSEVTVEKPTSVPRRFYVSVNYGGNRRFDIANCDLKEGAWWAPLSSLRFYRTGCSHAIDGFEQRGGHRRLLVGRGSWHHLHLLNVGISDKFRMQKCRQRLGDRRGRSLCHQGFIGYAKMSSLRVYRDHRICRGLENWTIWDSRGIYDERPF